MAKWKKTKDEAIAKVIETKINNPELSAKEIWEMAWISERTASRTIKKDLAKIGDKSVRVAKLIDSNDSLINLCDVELIKRINTEPEKLRPLELNTIKDSSFKQNQLLDLKPTEILDVRWADILKDIQSWKITKDSAYDLMKNV